MGEILFKFLIQKKIINRRATATHLQDNITSLDFYITTV